MAKVDVYQQAFNVGVVDKKLLPRVDLERMRLAAEIQTNLLPLTTGPAFLRPGLQFVGFALGTTRLKEFVFGAADAVLMEFSDQTFRVRVSDNPILRPAVTAAVTNGAFASGTGWTLSPTTGATTTVSGGFLNLKAEAKGSQALAKQQVTVNEQDVEHALQIVVERGPVIFRCGSTDGGDNYIAETTLRTGTHSLAFTPNTASFWVQFHSFLPILKRVDSITVEPAGFMTLATPWVASSLPMLRITQSADVCFINAEGYRQRRIERRGNRSWSIVDYSPDDGPFTLGRTAEVKLKSSVLEGNGTLTASSNFFGPSHVGALFTLFHEKQRRQTKLAAEGEYSDPIEVTGIAADNYTDRQWTYTVAGTWSGTLRWQRSFDEPDNGYTDFRNEKGDINTIPITGNTTKTNDDGDDNAIVFYRLGFTPGSYTSGVAEITIEYQGGGGDGICRVVGYTSPTQVDIEILKPFNDTAYTTDWREGEWSAASIYPSANTLHDGRLWHSGSDRIWGSVSDAFESFDDKIEGDSGPISRSIATGGVNDTQWLLSMARLVAGTEGSTVTAKSSSLDEPITPDNMSMKDSSTIGAAPTDPVKIDKRALFVSRDRAGLYEMVFDGAATDYTVTQLTKLASDIFAVGVKEMAVQRHPETRVWVVLDDGRAVCIVYEPDQEVVAFIPVETQGVFESVAVLPALVQDRVYFVVRRVIGGSTVRYVEKMALDSEVKPSNYCKVMDACSFGTNAPRSPIVPVGTHLAGATVVLWADGAPMTQKNSEGRDIARTFVVDASGNITTPVSVTSWVAGLPYTARYKSARLAYGAEGGTAMLQKKKVDSVGMIMTDFVRAGILYGQAFDNPARPLDPLPAWKDGITAPPIVLSDVAEEEPFVFPGQWDTDSRVCLEVSSPFTATVCGLVFSVSTNG